MALAVSGFVMTVSGSLGAGAAAAGAFGLSAQIGAFAGSAVLAAGKIGISYGLQSLLTPSTPAASGGRNVSTEGGVRPHAVVYGRGLLSGNVVAEHGWAKKGAKLKFYTRVYALAGHEIDAVEQWYIDGKPYTPNSLGFITSAPYRAKNYNFLQVFHSRGRRDEPVHAGYRAATHPRNSSSGNFDFSQSPWWRTTDRLRGRPWIAFVGEYDDAAFPGGQFPQVQAVCRGKKVYDPRKDDTQTGGTGPQRAEDPATWQWSDNWALCTIDYWRSEWGPMRDTVVNLTGRIMPRNSVNWPLAIAAANASDEHVPNGRGGVEARYRLWAYFPDNNNPRSNFDAMIRHGAGWYSEHCGQLSLWAGVYHAPAPDAPTIQEHWATGSVRVDRLKSILGRFNGVRGEWIDPAETWRAVSFPEVVDAEALARDKGRAVFQPMNQTFAPSASQALRVASIAIRRTLYPKTIDLPTDRLALTVGPGLTYPVDLPGRRVTGTTFKVIDWSFQAGGDEADIGQLTLEEEHPDIYRLPDSLSVSTPSYTYRSGLPNDNRVLPPDGIAEGVTIIQGAGHDLSWTAANPAEGAVFYEVWATSGTPAPPLEQVASLAQKLGTVRETFFRHSGLTPGQTWTYYVRVIDAGGLASGFRSSATVTTNGIAPGAFTNLTDFSGLAGLFEGRGFLF